MRETQDSRVTDIQDTGNLQFKVGKGDVPSLDIQNPTEKRKLLVSCTWLHSLLIVNISCNVKIFEEKMDKEVL